MTQKAINRYHAGLWMQGARPKTLTASFVPVLLGSALALKMSPTFEWMIAFQTLICALLIQIGINLTNDALDFKKGADNEKRIGFTRLSQMGIFSPQTILFVGFFCFAISVLFGLPLMWKAGWPLVIVVGASILFGYLYTGGPYPLAYFGLGDLFTFFFFGLVCTVTSFYVQSGSVNSEIFLAGSQIGCLSTVILAINNFRDMENDALSKKKTLAVLFGCTFARMEITLLTLIPYLISYWWFSKDFFWAGFLPLVALPLAVENILHFWKEDPSEKFNKYFIRSTQIHLVFGLTLILGILLK